MTQLLHLATFKTVTAAAAPPRSSMSRQVRASLMICSWVNSASPSSANSVPMPDCLAPPNGICGAMSRCLLIHTVPASIWLAILCARAVSDPQTIIGAVGAFDHVVIVGIFDHRQHRPELFLIDQPGAFLDVAHDGRLNKVAGPVDRRSAGDDVTVL